MSQTLTSLQPIDRYQSFFSLAACRCISLVGAGGKTSLMYALAAEYAQTGSSVLVTTTTHIFRPGADQADFVCLFDDAAPAPPPAQAGKITVYASQDPNTSGKLAAPPAAGLSRIAGAFDITLCEADGSKRLPFKVCRANEPVPFPGTDIFLQIAGLSAIGIPLKECCHRYPLAADYLNVNEDTALTPEYAAALIASPLSPNRALPPDKLKIICSQADLPGAAAAAGELAAFLVPLFQKRYGAANMPEMYAVSLKLKAGLRLI